MSLLTRPLALDLFQLAELASSSTSLGHPPSCLARAPSVSISRESLGTPVNPSSDISSLRPITFTHLL